MVFIYLFYYAISIIPIWIGVHYGRFTVVDYQYNQVLKRKRFWVIIFLYFMIVIQTGIAAWREEIIYSLNYHPSIALAAIIFFVVYVTLAVRIEIPRRYPKKKRWK